MINRVNNTKFFQTVLLSAFLSAPSFVFAVVPSRLEVQFESTPLFENTNFIPYDEVSRFAKVTNHTETAQEVIAEAINYSSCPLFSFNTCLAKKLHLKITSGEEMYFDDTLSHFYDMRGVSLGNLDAGAIKQYDFRIVFDGGLDDNDFQNSTTNFDLLVGFAGEGGGGVSTESGGGAVLTGLQINNEAAVSVSESTAGISWNTNYNAWGHVIYGIDTGTPYVLDLSLPNFGYPSSAPSDPALLGHAELLPKTTNHIVNLSGLTPGTTYRYRAVSHASPPTVGYEHTFTVPLNAGTNGAENITGENAGIGGSSELAKEGAVLGVMKINNDEMGNLQKIGSAEDISAADDEKNNAGSDKNLATAFGMFSGWDFPWWILPLLVLLLLRFVLKHKE